jgi:histone-lysine N-methyltransferase EZH2
MILDTLFQRLFFGSDESVNRPDEVTVPSLQHAVWDMIAEVTKTSRLQIIRRLREHATPAITTNNKNLESNDTDPLDTSGSSKNTTNTQKQKRNRLDVKYESFTDAYRKLWCRQCYIYDCNMHGLSEKPSVDVQTMLAKSKARDGYWVGKGSDDTSNANISGIPFTDNEVTEMPELGKAIFKQLYSIFEGNTADISCMLRVPIAVVEKYLSSIPQKSDLLDVLPLLTVRKRGHYNYYSVKNYKLEWYKQYRDSKIFSYFYPCLHDDVCQDTFNCSCIDNNFFCTDACSWNMNSPNFFRGCNCGGHCGQQCTCFLSKRECDPNICKCTTCTDPPHQPISKQRCSNDNLTMNRSPPLLIGISSVSGWGLFTRHALKVGDYVGKYIGELMSQDEADRRGLIADARECTYMFLISTDMSIDAGRKGNKLRFINHSDQPNLEPRST